MDECVDEDGFDDVDQRNEAKIRCIFYCEFHPTQGPNIVCQVPEKFISKELFDRISVYIITKAELQRSTITVTLSEYKILGYPVRIDDKKYQRNAFHFNLCIVCDSEARTVHYESVVTKFAEYLTAMEMESSFLSSGSTTRLTPILQQVLENLNKYGECALTEGPTATHLKVVRIRRDPAPVLDYQVPVFVRPLPLQQPWDLTTHQVAPHIDGFNHVARIASLADVENNLVKACVQNLLYYGIVQLVPLFQYGNVYYTTPKLGLLIHDDELQKRCIEFVARQGTRPHHRTTLPHLRDIFRMYAAMTRGTTVRDLCQRFNPTTLSINERKLVQFGVLEGLIRRVHKYPVLLQPPSSSGSTGQSSTDSLELQRSLNGSASIDEICCATGVSAQQLEDQLERDHNVVLLWK